MLVLLQGSEEVRTGSQGGRRFSPSPWAKQMKQLNPLLPSVPRSGTAPRPQSPLSVACRVTLARLPFLLLFFSAVPSFIRLTLISEIRITWSGEETLQTWRICFQPRKKTEVRTGSRKGLDEVFVLKAVCGCKSTGGAVSVRHGKKKPICPL